MNYDEVAEAYVRSGETKPFNALYERPGILGLLPQDLTGKTVLDAGCGGGWHAQALAARGATVVGFDASASMAKIAATRLAAPHVFRQWRLEDPLTFAGDHRFDFVVSALALHYVESLGPTLRELHRVTTSNGKVFLSMHHPGTDALFADGQSYYQKRQVSDVWQVAGEALHVTYWVRPLQEIFDAMYDSGWTNVRIHEPQPVPACQDFPREWEKLQLRPWFLFLSASA